MKMKRNPFQAIQTSAVASLFLVTLLLAGTGCRSLQPGSAAVQTKQSQAAITPGEALEKLKAGNQRFMEGRGQPLDLVAQRQATAAAQYPFAVVLSCVDSRCSSEQVFDQGIGDIFSARVAGNVLNDDLLGSMEFACKAAGAKLIAVVGHSSCGAVKGACAHVEMGNLTGLLQKIEPAVTATLGGAVKSKITPEQIDAVAEANVRLVLSQIRERSPILEGMIQDGQIELVGGMYDLETGRVTFFE